MSNIKGYHSHRARSAISLCKSMAIHYLNTNFSKFITLISAIKIIKDVSMWKILTHSILFVLLSIKLFAGTSGTIEGKVIDEKLGIYRKNSNGVIKIVRIFLKLIFFRLITF